MYVVTRRVDEKSKVNTKKMQTTFIYDIASLQYIEKQWIHLHPKEYFFISLS